MKCNKKIWILGIVIIIIFLSIGIVYKNKSISKKDVIATIGGEPVTYGEYLLFSSQIRASVINEVMGTYGISYDEGFWEFNMDGETPLDYLKMKTLESMQKLKVEQALIRSYGIADSFDYKNFEKQLEKENQRRLECVQKGEIIYGVIEYTENIYYTMLHEANVKLLKERILESMELTEEDLKKAYEEMKLEDEQFSNRDEITVQQVNAETDEVVETIIYDHVAVREMGNIPSDVYMACMTLKEGERTEKFQDSDGKTYVFLCIERKSGGYRSFDEMKEYTCERLLDKKYDEILNVQDKTIVTTKMYEKIGRN